MGAELSNSPSTTVRIRNYSGHKDDNDYPDLAELRQLGDAFKVSPRMLQIAFGWPGLDGPVLLDDDEMRQWIEQGGGNHSPTESAHARYAREP